MKYVKDEVSVKKEGVLRKLGTYECPIFESVPEAAKYLGDGTALAVLNKSWKVLVQAVARRAFQGGKTSEEVSKMVKDYRPGQQKTAVKKRAADAIVRKSAILSKNVELQGKVSDAIARNKWAEVLELLGE